MLLATLAISLERMRVDTLVPLRWGKIADAVVYRRSHNNGDDI